MDVSDGLVADLGKLCAASGAGAMVNGAGVPVAPELSEVFPGEALRMALDGGEDYQVLFAGPPAAVERAAVAIEGVAVIGEITSGCWRDGRRRERRGRWTRQASAGTTCVDRSTAARHALP